MASAYWRGLDQVTKEMADRKWQKEMYEKQQADRQEELELKRKWEQDDFWTQLEESRRTALMQQGLALQASKLGRTPGSTSKTTAGKSDEASEAVAWATNLADEVGGEKGRDLKAAIAANPNVAVELESQYNKDASDWSGDGMTLDLRTFANGVKLVGDITPEVEDYSNLNNIMKDLKTANLRDFDAYASTSLALAEEEARLNKKSAVTFNYTPPPRGENKNWVTQVDYLGTMVLNSLEAKRDAFIEAGEKAKAATVTRQIKEFKPGRSMSPEMWQIYDEHLPTILENLDTSGGVWQGLSENPTFQRYYKEEAVDEQGNPGDLGDGANTALLNAGGIPVSEAPNVQDSTSDLRQPEADKPAGLVKRREDKIDWKPVSPLQGGDREMNAMDALKEARENFKRTKSAMEALAESRSKDSDRGSAMSALKESRQKDEEIPLEEIQPQVKAGVKPRVIVDRVFRGKTIPAEKILQMNIDNGFLQAGDVVLMNGQKIIIEED